MRDRERFFSEPTLTIASVNIEGLTNNKQDLLSEFCRNTRCHVICIQETHRDANSPRPKIPGMKLAIEVPHINYGSVIFVKPDQNITSVSSTNVNNIEILTVEIGQCTVTSVYKPPRQEFVFDVPSNFGNRENCFVLGDFNSHSTAWGYAETNTDGSLVEEWADANNFSLIHDPKLPPSFHSKIWKRGTNPDICFTSTNLEARCIKMVYNPLPKTQHRPVGLNIYADIRLQTIPFRRRFNFRKANWSEFAGILDEAADGMEPAPENYECFVEKVKYVSRKTIPRGCRQQYIPGLTTESKKLLDQYTDAYEKDPFSDQTVESGNLLLKELSRARQEKWVETIEKLNMTHSSKIAWNLLKKLNADPMESKQPSNVTPDQIAHQLLINGKTDTKPRACKIHRNLEGEASTINAPFTIKDLNEAIHSLKNGKAAGVDDMCVEQIKHFGDKAKRWILQLVNRCYSTKQIPKSWRKSKVIALLKPGKDPSLASSYRPISLLCHLYKLYERLILNKIQNCVDQRLIPQQGGFRPGRSCTGQVLALTEHIERGFEERNITGVVFVDLSAAYDTVNQRALFSKIYKTTKDYELTRVIESLLQNRRYYVSLEGKKSRWRTQKNGLPQGSVLSPILFNIYTNDQPTPGDTEHFLYADDLAIAAQGKNFPAVEEILQNALLRMSAYYKANSLKPNPSKTQACAFHLNTKAAGRKLQIQWDGFTIEHTPQPKYLGVTLDRSLTYKFHCHKTRQKVSSRNQLLKKLTGSKWGAHPSVIRTTAEALCFSTAEYACPVWNRSVHVKSINAAVNETCRLMTGCMRATPLDKLYKAAGCEPPTTRRLAIEHTERFRQTFDSRHPLYEAPEPVRRLKSRRGFLSTVPIDPPEVFPLKQEPSAGSRLDWKSWKSLNRLRTGVAPVKTNLAKWGIINEQDVKCDCGATQTMEHLLVCKNCPSSCSLEDLWLAKDNALDVARYWADKL